MMFLLPKYYALFSRPYARILESLVMGFKPIGKSVVSTEVLSIKLVSLVFGDASNFIVLKMTCCIHDC